nr:immunoglobulin heavy chain junction region [Mus musculus]MBK4189442.1 immunoglobulin heavy chain junction region [Mus musculus]MBK4189443.1 immunoglobulin heavy chain junction region [Mus musculus]MBK4189444.1 immunoglobulin heavy chain junction region [Mus musculus]MBK4189445.1 immunoglobulin heavy chain junction region [Mus musculus]
CAQEGGLLPFAYW